MLGVGTVLAYYHLGRFLGSEKQTLREQQTFICERGKFIAVVFRLDPERDGVLEQLDHVVEITGALGRGRGAQLVEHPVAVPGDHLPVDRGPIVDTVHEGQHIGDAVARPVIFARINAKGLAGRLGLFLVRLQGLLIFANMIQRVAVEVDGRDGLPARCVLLGYLPSEAIHQLGVLPVAQMARDNPADIRELHLLLPRKVSV